MLFLCCQELASLLKADPVVGYHWRRFLHQKGLQPSARADEAIVQEFSAMHSAGTLDQIEIASTEVLADFDKVQKEHPAATWLWVSVAAREAFGTVNPKGCPAKIVQDFLEAFRAGSFEQLELASDGLAAEVKSFQKAGGKEEWQAFGQSQFGYRVAPLDPKSWPADLVRGFLETADVKQILETAKVKKKTAKVKQEKAKVDSKLIPIFKADPVAFYHWRQFQHQKGLEPSARANEEIVQEFLALRSAGTLDQIEIASTEVLADFDKVQKEHPAARWLWLSVAAREAFGDVNPRGVPAKIVQDFLESYRAGSFEHMELASDELAAEVNLFQKAGGKEEWQAFANSQFGYIVAPSDPKSWPADLVRGFLETAEVKQILETAKIEQTTSVEKAKVDTKLTPVFKADPVAFYHWKEFLLQKGLETSASRDEEAVQEFLAMRSGGTLDQFEIASAEVLEEFDRVQKKHPAAKRLWASVAARAAFGIVNPRGVPAKLVQDFLESFHAGSLEQVEMASETTTVKKKKKNKKIGDATKFKQEKVKVDTKLTSVFKADPVAFYHWRAFQQQKGLQTFTSRDEELVQEFLAMHSAGALDPIEVASAQVLADFDKVQKEHPAATWLWASVGARAAFGIVNPKGIPAKIVQDFLESYRAGSFEQPEIASDELAAEVNSFQKAGGKAKWQAFANSQFGPKAAPSDPKFWPADLLRRFLAEQPA
ncbi:unnamed protein product [Polarella glacialis]|uniref:Uncharacterized protein n=1 Tax=Polarella glacialis TaxID=89957 RepID=A0A813GPF1_POLGL|nr:unnamed protein product [Polarella glacialis]CAE8743929.1 unnamed protein product [Polarella glacialis]